MKASVLSFRAAVTFLVAGMIWGLVMAISQDFSNMPAHARAKAPGRFVAPSPSVIRGQTGMGI